MNLRTAGLLAMLAGSTLASPASFAVATANASVGNFVVTLTDLDLTDGVTPYFELIGQESRHFVSTELKTDNNTRTVFDGRNTRSWQPIEIETLYEAPAGGTERFTGAASISGSTLRELQLNTSASAAGNAQLGYTVGTAQASDYFRLSPFTALSISFDLTVDSALSDPAGPGGAGAETRVAFYIPSLVSQDFVNTYSVGYGRPNQGAAGTVTRTFDLTSDFREIELSVLASARSVGSNINANVPPPIPEPQSYAMLLAGLGLIGASAARRRKQRGL